MVFHLKYAKKPFNPQLKCINCVWWRKNINMWTTTQMKPLTSPSVEAQQPNPADFVLDKETKTWQKATTCLCRRPPGGVGGLMRALSLQLEVVWNRPSNIFLQEHVGPFGKLKFEQGVLRRHSANTALSWVRVHLTWRTQINPIFLLQLSDLHHKNTHRTAVLNTTV